MAGGRGEVGGLVHPERVHPHKAGRVVDQRGAVLGHRAHHRAPPQPEVERAGGDGLAAVADPATRLPRGTGGQRGPRRDLRAGLRPRRHLAVLVTASPQPLDPDQHRRPAADGQVPHPHRTPPVGGRDRPATRAADQVCGGLHRELELAVVLVDRDQREVLETEDHRPQIPHASSVHAHLGPPSEVSKHHEE